MTEIPDEAREHRRYISEQGSYGGSLSPDARAIVDALRDVARGLRDLKESLDHPTVGLPGLLTAVQDMAEAVKDRG